MKKAFIGVLSLSFIFALTGCNSDVEIRTNTTGVFPTNQVSQTESNDTDQGSLNLVTPEYHDAKMSLSLTQETSKVTSVEETVEKVYDSVVSITASSVSATSAGSGVLIGSDENLGLSYLATCFHVIEDAKKFDVTLSDGTTYAASLVGGYSDLDLAVLSIEAEGLTYAKVFEDSDTLKLGSSVVCIGNPLGTLPGSVSSGVVSYVNRQVKASTYSTRTLIQTDVAINSGNSGGGLFNTAGALIGIVNAKYSSTGIEGLGFAIPSNDVVDTVNSLLATAKYDSANKIWSAGYVEGDYEFGFSITLGYYSSGFGWSSTRNYVYYVNEVSSNETASGAKELKVQDIVSGVKVDYKDEAMEDVTLTLSTENDLMTSLYSLNLSLEDSLIFTISRNNQTITVSVPVIQFIYTI